MAARHGLADVFKYTTACPVMSGEDVFASLAVQSPTLTAGCQAQQPPGIMSMGATGRQHIPLSMLDASMSIRARLNPHHGQA